MVIHNYISAMHYGAQYVINLHLCCCINRFMESDWCAVTIEIHYLIIIMELHEGFMEFHSWFVDLHNWLSEHHMQFCNSINREHWRGTIIRYYVSPSTELWSSINWIKELHELNLMLREFIWEIHQSVIENLHMGFKELHNPTSFMELNNWYLQPHSWFAELHNWFVEFLIYS